MKKSFKVFSLLAIVALIGLSSCTKIVESLLPPFETDLAQAQISIPVVTNIDAQGEIGHASVKFNLDSIVKVATANQYSISKVSSISVKEMQLVFEEANE